MVVIIISLWNHEYVHRRKEPMNSFALDCFTSNNYQIKDRNINICFLLHKYYKKWAYFEGKWNTLKVQSHSLLDKFIWPLFRTFNRLHNFIGQKATKLLGVKVWGLKKLELLHLFLMLIVCLAGLFTFFGPQTMTSCSFGAPWAMMM